MTETLESIQPVVLVGGSSRRFGRDKLREPMAPPEGGWLVDRPIEALRAVFGARVAVIGACHPSVATRADSVIPDPRPGVGPVGGILSALEASPGPIFVLAGDLPGIDAATVRRILDAAPDHPRASVVRGFARRPHPCIALYRRGAIEALTVRLREGNHRLLDALPPDLTVDVPIDPRAAENLNSPREA